MHRRALLASAGAAAAGALAGCTSVLGGDPPELRVDNATDTTYTVAVTVRDGEGAALLDETVSLADDRTFTVESGQPAEVVVRVGDGEERAYYWDGNGCEPSVVVVNGENAVDFQEAACD